MLDNSFVIKTMLLHYYRFERGYICADEVSLETGEIADILVDTGLKIIEIEVKTSKSDLVRDKFKKKHSIPNQERLCNLFYYCVPEELKEDTLAFAKTLNPSYGVIYVHGKFGEDIYRTIYNSLVFSEKAKALHKEYKPYPKLYKRLSSIVALEYISRTRKILDKTK